jgi:hypothetical protein
MVTNTSEIIEGPDGQPFYSVTIKTQLKYAADALLVEDLSNYQVFTLLTQTWSEQNELHAYSYGAKIQSSDYAKMNSKSMAMDEEVIPVAIEIPAPFTKALKLPSPSWILFDT